MRSVGGRLFLSYLAVVAVGLVAASIALSGILVRYENDTVQLRLTELSAPLLAAMTTGLRQGQQPREVIDALTEQAKAADSRLLILSNNRRVLVDSDNAMANQTVPTPTSGNFGSFSDKSDPWLFVQSTFRPAATGVNPAIIVVARPRAAFADALRVLLPALVAAAAGAPRSPPLRAGRRRRGRIRPHRRRPPVAHDHATASRARRHGTAFREGRLPRARP